MWVKFDVIQDPFKGEILGDELTHLFAVSVLNSHDSDIGEVEEEITVRYCCIVCENFLNSSSFFCVAFLEDIRDIDIYIMHNLSAISVGCLL